MFLGCLLKLLWPNAMKYTDRFPNNNPLLPFLGEPTCHEVFVFNVKSGLHSIAADEQVSKSKETQEIMMNKDHILAPRRAHQWGKIPKEQESSKNF